MKTAGLITGLFILATFSHLSNPDCNVKGESPNTPSSDGTSLTSGSGWVQTWSTTVDQGSCDVMFIAEGHDGSIYTLGNYHRIIDFDPTEDEFTRGIDQSGVSIYVSKFDRDGQYLWTRIIYGGLGYDLCGLGTNSTGDIYISGQFDTSADFDPGDGEVIRLANNIVGQNYLLKLNPNGEFQWVRTWLGERQFPFAVGSNDLIYVGGKQTQTIVDRNNESAQYNFATETDIPPFDEDCSFILAFDIDGNNIDILTWKSYEDQDFDINDIAVGSDGSLLLAGDFTGQVNLAPSGGDIPASSMGETDAFLTFISPDKSTILSKTWGNTLRDSATSITLNSAGEIFILGFFDSTVDFDPGDGEYILVSNGSLDCYVSQFDSDLNFINAVSWGGLDFEMGHGITVGRDDNVLVWGRFGSLTDFDPGELENTREMIGFADGFLTKFDPALNFQWVYTLGMGEINSVLTDDANNIFVGGAYKSTVDFDPGENVDEQTVFHYLADTSYLMKLAPNGGWTEDYVPMQSSVPMETSLPAETSLGPDVFQNAIVIKSSNLDSETRPVNQLVMEIPGQPDLSTGGWAEIFGAEREDLIAGLGVDPQGNAYILFGDGGGALSRASNPKLRKYTPDGNLEWQRNFSNTPESCLFVDDNGNSYVGSSQYVTARSSGDSFRAATLTKLTSDGDFEYIHTLGMNGNSCIDAVYVTDSGHIYISGYFSETEDFDLGPEVYELAPPGRRGAFIAMYNPQFEFMWAATWEGRYWLSGKNLCVDNEGDVYISGHMIEDNPARSTSDYTSTNFDTVNTFIRKFTWNGDPVWAYVFDNQNKCYLMDMTMDNEGSSYLCGYYSGQLDADPGTGVFELNANEEDALIIKMNSDGIFQWAKTISGEYFQESVGIAISPDNRIFVTGDFMYEVDFDPGDGEFFMSPSTQDQWAMSMDAYLCILTPDGDFLNAVQLGGFVGHNRGFSIAFDVVGNVFWTGIFTASERSGNGLDFNPGEGEDFHTSPGMGLNDVFLVKYNPDLTW